MNRRDFFRVLGVAIAAFLAGESLLEAIRAELERERRRQQILAQIEYQTAQCYAAIMRKWEQQWNGTSDGDYTFYANGYGPGLNGEPVRGPYLAARFKPGDPIVFMRGGSIVGEGVWPA